MVNTHSQPVRVLPLAPGPAGVHALHAAIVELLDSRDHVLAPVPDVSEAWARRYSPPAVAPGPGVVLHTSGSTGAPKPVALSLDALISSDSGARALLGLESVQWVTAIPVWSAGGFNTVFRNALHGLPPRTELRAGPGATAVSLVPAQVARADLAGFDAVLVGGGASAHLAGPNLVRTYGLTETCGGCVYDGVPMPDVELAIVDGEIVVTGPFGRVHTGDLGAIVDGRLVVHGRRDDIVEVNGTSVSVAAVEALLNSQVEAAVVAVPDPARGHSIVAWVVGQHDPESLAALVVDELGRAARPVFRSIDRLPTLPNGKVDRASLRRSV